MAHAFRHLVADFTQVPAVQLTDGPLLTGLLIAAAGAAGLAAVGAPVIRPVPGDGFAAVLVLEGCHVTVHTFPARGLLLLDVLAPAAVDCRKALDVFARRMSTAHVTTTTRDRG
ncbi:MAG: hypothetical protein NVS1B4_21230 [Gemmatimonadaceae bacterium]